MFDIGFTELLLIALVGLLVIGPERLPEAVRTVSLYVGRLTRGLREARTQFEREIGAEDIRRQLHNEAILKQLQESQQELNTAAKRVEDGLKGDLTGNLDEPAATPAIKPTDPATAADHPQTSTTAEPNRSTPKPADRNND